MAILAPTSDDDLLADQIRKRQMLQAMPGINGQQDPSVPPDQAVNPQGSPISPPPQAPVAPPPPTPDAPAIMPPSTSPYQAQIEALNKNVSNIGQAGADLSTLKGQRPTTSQYPVSKLRAGLLMPLEILAAAGGQDVSKEYGGIIRPGYNKAMSAYQAKVDAAQSKFDTLRETTKAQLDALKEEGVITNQQAEAAYRQAETDIKKQELPIRLKEAETARQSIPPLNQGIQMGRDLATKQGREFTAKDFNQIVDDYWTAQERSRMAAEVEKYKMEKIAKDEEKKTARQETNVSQDISREQARLTDIIKPLQTARQSITNLKTLRAEGNDDGFARLLAVIMADNTLANASHGSVRQNIGIINELIKSPGWIEYLKGKAQGILQPGKGSISDATMKQIDKILNNLDKQLDTETTAAVGNLVDLNGLDPTDSGTRDRLGAIIKRQYDIPQPPKATPDVNKPNPNKPAIQSPNKAKRLQGMSDKELDDAIEKAKGQ